MKKIYSIESIRAFACLGVFLCHFKGAFFPNSIWVQFLMKTPFNILFSGNTPVRLMFVVSGLVLSYKYFMRECYEEVPYDILKRYFRLGIPVFFACMFSYVLMKCHLMLNVEVATITHSENFLGIFNNFEPNLMLFLQEGLYGVLFLGSNAYVAPMWTMVYEMLGSILVLGLISLFRNNQKLRILFYVVFLLLYRNYYAYFILGMIISDFICYSNIQKNWSKKKEIICMILVLLSGLYICNPRYIDGSWFDFWIFSIACLVMFPCFIYSTTINKVFGERNRVCMWIAKNSFAIYLIHWPVIESFSCRSYVKLLTYFDYRIAGVITLVTSLAVVLILAETFRRFIESAAQIIGNNIVRALKVKVIRSL